MARNLNAMIKPVSLIRPKTITSTETGTGVDCAAYQDDALAVLDLGAALTDGTEKLDVVIQKCSDAGGTGAATIGTFTQLTGLSDNKNAAIPVVLNDATKKFIRAVATVSGGGTPSFAISVQLLVRPTEAMSDSLNSATAA